MYKRMALNGLALLGLLSSTTVLAEIQPGFYVGAGIGSATIEFDEEVDDFRFDADDTAFKVFGGYNFNQYFAIEAAYFDGGKPKETVVSVPGFRGDIEIGTTGLIASVIGRLPIGDYVSVYGKLGYASYESELKGRVNGDVIDSATFDDEDVAWGAGIAFNVGPSFELRGEYDNIDMADGDFSILSVNGVYKF
ncbi:porin family protein [Steroidobacter cummioxidans]|uniref:porin family protein n=1 Tax=Steroidobacter cummioxidans TaxID=1803913 RepID=UPI000E31DBB2|nr:porin family protein [Steroidobacter cummioxidans]